MDSETRELLDRLRELEEERDQMDVPAILESLRDGAVIRLDSNMDGDSHCSVDMKKEGTILTLASKDIFYGNDWGVRITEHVWEDGEYLVERLGRICPFVEQVEPEQSWLQDPDAVKIMSESQPN